MVTTLIVLSSATVFFMGMLWYCTVSSMIEESRKRRQLAYETRDDATIKTYDYDDAVEIKKSNDEKETDTAEQETSQEASNEEEEKEADLPSSISISISIAVDVETKNNNSNICRRILVCQQQSKDTMEDLSIPDDDKSREAIDVDIENQINPQTILHVVSNHHEIQ